MSAAFDAIVGYTLDAIDEPLRDGVASEDEARAIREALLADLAMFPPGFMLRLRDDVIDWTGPANARANLARVERFRTNMPSTLRRACIERALERLRAAGAAWLRRPLGTKRGRKELRVAKEALAECLWLQGRRRLDGEGRSRA